VAGEPTPIASAAAPLTGGLELRTLFADTRRPAGGTALSVERSDGADEERVELDTDAGGRALLNDLAPGTWSVRAERGPASEVCVRAGERGQVTLALPRGVNVTARAVDAGGAPVADAEVWISWPGHPETGRVVGATDDTGRLEVAGVDPTAWVGVRHADYRTPRLAYVSDRAREVPDEIVFALRDAPPPLRGRVSDGSGSPIAGAVIEAIDSSRFPPHARRHGSLSLLPANEPVRTDAGGAFELPVPSAGCELHVRAPGYSTELVPVPRRPSTRLEITLGAPGVVPMPPQARRLQGFARDAHGAALAGWRVVLEEELRASGEHPLMFAAPSRAGRRTARTDDEGRFQFESCRPQAHVVWLTPTEGALRPHAVATGVPSGSDPLVLTARAPTARVHGVAPGLERGLAVLASSALIAPVEVELEDTGHFAAANLPSGEYTLSLWSAGRLDLELRRFELSAGTTLDLGQVALDERGALRAQVYVAGGRMPPRVVAKLTRNDGPAAARFPTEMSATGELYFALLDPGDYTLRVEAPGLEPGTVELTVVRGEETRVELPLELAFR
jgi:hypothetical protein